MPALPPCAACVTVPLRDVARCRRDCRAPDAAAVGRRRRPVRAARRASGARRTPDVVEQLADIDALTTTASRPRSAARQHEQVLGEQREPVGLLRRRSGRLLKLANAASAAGRELQLDLHPCQRRAQLVAGVGDKLRSRANDASRRASIPLRVCARRRTSSSAQGTGRRSASRPRRSRRRGSAAARLAARRRRRR